MPYSHRVNNFRGCIISDIRKGMPPAHRADVSKEILGQLWDSIEYCWHTDPSLRSSASAILHFLLKLDPGEETKQASEESISGVQADVIQARSIALMTEASVIGPSGPKDSTKKLDGKPLPRTMVVIDAFEPGLSEWPPVLSEKDEEVQEKAPKAKVPEHEKPTGLQPVFTHLLLSPPTSSAALALISGRIETIHQPLLAQSATTAGGSRPFPTPKSPVIPEESLDSKLHLDSKFPNWRSTATQMPLPIQNLSIPSADGNGTGTGAEGIPRVVERTISILPLPRQPSAIEPSTTNSLTFPSTPMYQQQQPYSTLPNSNIADIKDADAQSATVHAVPTIIFSIPNDTPNTSAGTSAKSKTPSTAATSASIATWVHNPPSNFPWPRKKTEDPIKRSRTTAPSSSREFQRPPQPPRAQSLSYRQLFQQRLQKYQWQSTFSVDCTGPRHSPLWKVSFFLGSTKIGESTWFADKDLAKENAAMQSLGWLNTYGYH